MPALDPRENTENVLYLHLLMKEKKNKNDKRNIKNTNEYTNRASKIRNDCPALEHRKLDDGYASELMQSMKFRKCRVSVKCIFCKQRTLCCHVVRLSPITASVLT